MCKPGMFGACVAVHVGKPSTSDVVRFGYCGVSGGTLVGTTKEMLLWGIVRALHDPLV